MYNNGYYVNRGDVINQMKQVGYDIADELEKPEQERDNELLRKLYYKQMIQGLQLNTWGGYRNNF